MKPASEFLFWWSEWAIALGLFALLAAATELGFRLGRRAVSIDRERRSQLGAIEAAVLAIVGLVLAFAFGLAGDRFQALRVRVGSEVLAIARAWRRADLLEEPLRASLRSDLSAHLDARLELARAADAADRERLEAGLDAIGRIEERLGAISARVGRERPHEERTSLVVAAVDDVIDARLSLFGTVRDRLPSGMLFLLLAMTAAALLVVGYANGVSGDRAVFGTTVLAALTVAIVLLIVDLDRPGRGLIRIRQDQLFELSSWLHRT